MVSNFDDKGMRSAISEGKRHYHFQKKTSLYGSESPREDKTHNFRIRHTNPDNIFGSGEEEILNKSSFMDESKKLSSDQEKRATLDELRRYNPWGKPGAGAPNEVSAASMTGNRARWEYEQEMKARDKTGSSSDETFPGFTSGFGMGKSSGIGAGGRRRPDNGQQPEEKSNNYFQLGGPSTNGSNGPGASGTAYKNQDQEDLTYKKYEETKAMADNLEKEIQQLKFKQMEERYASMNNEKNEDYGYEAEHDHRDKSSYEDDALYREAENRARLRELDRLKESYDKEYSENESTFSNERENHNEAEANGNRFTNDNIGPNGQRRQRPGKKDSGTNNRNDYRPYTVEEYMNCRPQIINPSLNKRTTLSGSEERRSNYNNNINNTDSAYNHNNNSTSMQMIDEENIIRKFSKSNTHNNLFPSDRIYSPGSTQYQTKAPYATD